MNGQHFDKYWMLWMFSRTDNNITLDSGIDVGQGINVGPGNLAKRINVGP